MGLTSMCRECWTYAATALPFRTSVLRAESACSFRGNNHGAKEFVVQVPGPIPLLEDLYLFGQHESEKHGVLRREESPQSTFRLPFCGEGAEQVI